MCLVKCRLSVWQLMWVVFVVRVGGSMCGVVKNCSAWFVLVNVGFVERSAFFLE